MAKSEEAQAPTAAATVAAGTDLTGLVHALREQNAAVAELARAVATRPGAPAAAVGQPAALAPVSRGPTRRVVLAADLIKKGTPVAEAMERAGYGARFIAGNAATFARFLASDDVALLTAKQAAKAASGGRAAVAAEED